MNGWLTIKTRLLTGNVKSGLKEIVKSFTQAKGETLTIAKSFAKMAGIILIVAGVFKAIVGGMNALLERNDELANKIQGIKLACSNLIQGIFTAVANLLEPAVTKIIDLIFKFMVYLNVITKEFFGLDLFAKSTNKSLKGASKSAKEIKKSLAGFDEINMLNENTTAGGGGGAGGGSTADFKMPEIDTAKFEEKVQSLKNDWSDILKISLKEAHDTFIGGDNSIWGYVKLGLFWIEQGFVKTFDGIIKIFKGDFKEGFKGVLEGIGTLILGTMTSALSLVIELIKASLKTFKNLWLTIIDMIASPIIEAVNIGKSVFGKLWQAVKDIGAGIKKLFTGDLKGALNSFKSAFGNVMSALWTLCKAPLNLIISGINALIRGLNRIQIKTPDWLGGKSFGINIPQIPKLASGGIVSNPGAGVNMGSYIAGEKGAEAVIPLTDNTLQRLANMIPITIDLTNTIDGRVLSKRLETIRMNDNFARNGVR